VITAAPSVKGSARSISILGKRVKDFFQEPCTVIAEAAKRLSGIAIRLGSRAPDRAAWSSEALLRS